MTFLEKFLEDHPNAPLDNDGSPTCCPYCLGYEDRPEKLTYCGNSTTECKKCWDREMPKVVTVMEKLLEVFPGVKMDFYGKTPDFCVKRLGLEGDDSRCDASGCERCWSQKYKENIV